LIRLLVPLIPPIEAAIPYYRKSEEARHYSNFGPCVLELERRLSEHFAGAYITTTSSCTSGLEIAYTLGHITGYEKIELPALTYPATWMAATRSGLEILPIDVDPDTWIAPGVAGFGLPSYAPIVDAAGAFGEQRVPIITEGMTAVFSAHCTKPLGVGEAGWIVTWDQGASEEYRAMSQFGINGQTGFGLNAKMSELHAAMALAALDAWPGTRARYLQLFDWYDKYLPAGVTPQKRPRGVYPILAVKLPQMPGGALAAVAAMRERGIECRQWYVPTCDRLPLFTPKQPKEGALGGHRRAQAKLPHLPVTAVLAESLIGLPWHLWLSESDVKQVCEALGAVIEVS
jgi:dTDP-4-amino-4,6-dideoxygalactose transaminase